MQTIRIYRIYRALGRSTLELVASITGANGKVETQMLRDTYPESEYLWLR